MIRPVLLLFPVVLAVPLLAQKVEIKVQDQNQAERFTIASKFQTTDTGKTLVNGEEGALGGGGRRGGAPGGGGETTLTQEIDFVQGPASDDYRDYKKLAAVESRPGQDGAARETKIEGGLQGKKVFLKSDAKGAVEMVEGKGDTAKPVSAALVRGVPGRVSFAGFVPANAVNVGEDFDLGKTFVSALRGVVHPVTADRPAQDAAGQGGQGGQGQRGNRGQGGAQFGGRGGAGSTVIQLLSAGKLDVNAHGKVVSVDKKDGDDIATIEVVAKLTGKGKAEDLGLQAMGGGRGGRGGQGAQAPAADSTNNVDAAFDIKGKVTVNLTQHCVTKVVLDGDLTVNRENKSTRDINGEATKIERTTNTKGKFSVQASCEAAGK